MAAKLLLKDGKIVLRSGKVVIVPDGATASDCVCCDPVTCDSFTCATLPTSLKFKIVSVTPSAIGAEPNCCGETDPPDLPIGIEFDVPRVACDDTAKTADYYLSDETTDYPCLRDIGIALACIDGTWSALITSTFPIDGGPLTITSTSPFAANNPAMFVSEACQTTVELEVYE